jgi:hypothetical protein
MNSSWMPSWSLHMPGQVSRHHFLAFSIQWPAENGRAES